MKRFPLWLFVAAMAGFLVFDLAWFGPWLRPYLARKRMLAEVSAADTLYAGMLSAIRDREQGKALGVPWPAESGAKTTGDYLSRLAAAHYLTPEERDRCRILVIANVGPKDASDTLLFASRNVYDRLVRKRNADGPFVLYRKSGEGDVATEIPHRDNLPARSPAFLAP